MNAPRFLLLISLIVTGLGVFQILPAKQIKLGELELIYTEDEIPIRYDGSLSTLMVDGEMHFFHSGYIRKSIFQVLSDNISIQTLWCHFQQNNSRFLYYTDGPDKYHCGN